MNIEIFQKQSFLKNRMQGTFVSKQQAQNQIEKQEKQFNLVIHNVIPFNHQYFFIDNNCEPNQLICKHGSEVSSFYFESELEAFNMKEALKALYHNKIYNDQIYIHIPDLKKISKENLSNISSKFIKQKSKQITSKIDHHKNILQLLLRARYLLDVQGERIDYEFSEDQGLNNSRNYEMIENVQEEDGDAYDPDIN